MPLLAPATVLARRARHLAWPALITLALAPGLHARGQGTKAVGVTADAVRDAVAALPANLQAPGRHALIVGAGTYHDPRIPDLPACANDARGLHAVLTDPSVGMFPAENVTLLVDEQVNKDAVIDALDQLGRRAGADDVVLVFFSGHGAVDSRGRSYWVMHPTKADRLRATGLAENEITDLLSDIPTSRLVTLIDACYSASTASLGENKSLLDVGKLYPRFNGKGRVAITASAGDQLSVVIPKGQEGHGYSAFAYHAIQGLKGAADGAAGGNREGVVTVDELWGYVKDRTATTARRAGGQQQPQLKGQMGSKFMLTVNRERLVAQSQGVKQALAALRTLALDGDLGIAQFQQAQALLSTNPNELDEQDQQRRNIYTDLADGKLAPAYLQAALDTVETPQQRAARLAREAQARAAQERQAKIDTLWATAQANDNKAQGKTALTALNQLLAFAPDHREAKALRDKIARYYGPQKVGDTWTNRQGMAFAYIPAGEFLMGSPQSEDGRDDDETQHRVHITQPLLMGVTEVTRKQFAAFVNDTGHRTDAEKDGEGGWGVDGSEFKQSTQYSWRHTGFEYEDDHPVVNVSWNDAVAYCRWLGKQDGRTYTLPTEAQWEYACRAGTQGKWGGQVGTGLDFANTADQSAKRRFPGLPVGDLDDGRVFTAPVAGYAANRWGLHDTIGNVWEWCSDWYGDYPGGTARDPRGPRQGEYRVLRGGSWGNEPRHCRAANRSYGTPGYRDDGVGFRVVLAVPSPGLP